MAVEVDHGYYIFTQEPDPPAREADGSGLGGKVNKKKFPSRKSKKVSDAEDLVVDTPVVPSKEITDVFRYNALHDLESVLWIAIHFVTNTERRLASDPFDTSLSLTRRDREIAAELFYNVNARAFAMSQPTGIIEEVLRSLPAPMANVGPILADLKATLVALYKKAEKDPLSIGKDVSSDLHYTLSVGFELIQNELDKIGDVTVKPIKIPIDPSRQARRKRRAIDDLSTCPKKQRLSQLHVFA